MIIWPTGYRRRRARPRASGAAAAVFRPAFGAHCRSCRCREARGTCPAGSGTCSCSEDQRRAQAGAIQHQGAALAPEDGEHHQSGGHPAPGRGRSSAPRAPPGRRARGLPHLLAALPARPGGQAPGDLLPLHAQEAQGLRPRGRPRQGDRGGEIRAARQERPRAQGTKK